MTTKDLVLSEIVHALDKDITVKFRRTSKMNIEIQLSKYVEDLYFHVRRCIPTKEVIAAGDPTLFIAQHIRRCRQELEDEITVDPPPESELKMTVVERYDDDIAVDPLRKKN